MLIAMFAGKWDLRAISLQPTFGRSFEFWSFQTNKSHFSSSFFICLASLHIDGQFWFVFTNFLSINVAWFWLFNTLVNIFIPFFYSKKYRFFYKTTDFIRLIWIHCISLFMFYYLGSILTIMLIFHFNF